MSPENNNPPDPISADAAGAARAPLVWAAERQPAATLAHELANLLDGSLRHLGLAISSLRPTTHVTDSAAEDDDILQRLEAASTAMHQMASLIHRWMAMPAAPDALYHESRTLDEAIGHAVKLLRPATLMRHIHVNVSISEAATALPAGPVYPIIANALRNSIEAMDRMTHDVLALGRRIDIAASVDNGQVKLVIADTGPGIDASLFDKTGRFALGVSMRRGGHGLGLQLSHDIALSLHGSLQITNREPRGAELTLRYPVHGVKLDP